MGERGEKSHLGRGSLLFIASGRPFFCFLCYFKSLAAIKVYFFPVLSKKFMSRIRSFGFQKGFQAVPKMSFLLKKRFASCKKADHRKFGFFTLGTATPQKRC